MNAKLYNTGDYENKWQRRVRKNKPNSNPISEKPKMNVNLYILKDYDNVTAFRPRKNKPNSKPISSKAKMNKKSSHTQKYPKEQFVLEFRSKSNRIVPYV